MHTTGRCTVTYTVCSVLGVDSESASRELSTVAEDFTLQHADDTKMLFHARTTQQGHGPHVAICVCVRCVTEKTSREELSESFAKGDMRLNVDKTTYGTLDVERVPGSTKLVGSYMSPSEEVSARVTAASKAYYKMKTVMR